MYNWFTFLPYAARHIQRRFILVAAVYSRDQCLAAPIQPLYGGNQRNCRVSCTAQDCTSMPTTVKCISAFRPLMSHSRSTGYLVASAATLPSGCQPTASRSNPAKTLAMWLRSKLQLDRFLYLKCPDAHDLGVVLNSKLSTSAHVSSVCRSAYCQLRQLLPIVLSLSVDARTTVIRAFISSRLDYCNRLLYGVADD